MRILLLAMMCVLLSGVAKADENTCQFNYDERRLMDWVLETLSLDDGRFDDRSLPEIKHVSEAPAQHYIDMWGEDPEIRTRLAHVYSGTIYLTCHDPEHILVHEYVHIVQYWGGSFTKNDPFGWIEMEAKNVENQYIREYSYSQPQTMHFHQTIKIGDGEKFIEAFDGVTRRHVERTGEIIIDINSNGGEVGEAHIIASFLEFLRTKYGVRIITVVQNDNICFSACPIIFAAGDVRVVSTGAKFGFHAVSIPPNVGNVSHKLEQISSIWREHVGNKAPSFYQKIKNDNVFSKDMLTIYMGRQIKDLATVFIE